MTETYFEHIMKMDAQELFVLTRDAWNYVVPKKHEFSSCSHSAVFKSLSSKLITIDDKAQFFVFVFKLLVSKKDELSFLQRSALKKMIEITKNNSSKSVDN